MAATAIITPTKVITTMIILSGVSTGRMRTIMTMTNTIPSITMIMTTAIMPTDMAAAEAAVV